MLSSIYFVNALTIYSLQQPSFCTIIPIHRASCMPVVLYPRCSLPVAVSNKWLLISAQFSDSSSNIYLCYLFSTYCPLFICPNEWPTSIWLFVILSRIVQGTKRCVIFCSLLINLSFCLTNTNNVRIVSGCCIDSAVVQQRRVLSNLTLKLLSIEAQINYPRFGFAIVNLHWLRVAQLTKS